MSLDLDMGKYGFYVWSCYGISALGLGGLILLSLKQQAKSQTALKALQAQIDEAAKTAPTQAEGPDETPKP